MRNLFLLAFFSLFLVGCETMPEQSGGMASDYYQRGMNNFDAERYVPAIEDFQNAVRVDPRYGEAFYMLGRSYSATNRNQLALNAYLDAVSVQPSLGKAHARAGILYFERREYGPAESHLKKAIDLSPIDALAHYYLAEIYRMQGKCTPSVTMYKKALSLDPNLLDARDGLRRAQSEICRARKTSSSSRPASSQPVYEKATEFSGGGRALKPSEW